MIMLSWLDYRCHCHVRSDSLSCVIIADMDYPVRVVFTLMNKVMRGVKGIVNNVVGLVVHVLKYSHKFIYCHSGIS